EFGDIVTNDADHSAAAASPAGFQEVHPEMARSGLLFAESDRGRRFGNVVLRDRVGHAKGSKKIVEAIENVASRRLIGRVAPGAAVGHRRGHVARAAKNGQAL